MVGGLVDHYFFNLDFPHSGSLFWVYAALTVVTIRISEEARDDGGRVQVSVRNLRFDHFSTFSDPPMGERHDSVGYSHLNVELDSSTVGFGRRQSVPNDTTVRK
jgi:hypothetical protein